MLSRMNLKLATIVRWLRRCVGLRPAISNNTPAGDIELTTSTQQSSAPVRHLSRGFPSLAAFISSNPKSESFIFKRFDELAARNLLYLQSELAHLHHSLKQFDDLDQRDPQARACARSWAEFERMKDTNADQRERWGLIRRIRETLREYHDTLLRQSKVAALETPSLKVLEAFNTEFYGYSPSLLGPSKDIYESEESSMQDLAQLYSTERNDRVSAFLANHMFRWLQTKRSAKQMQFDPRVSYLHSQRLDLAVELFYALLSITLLLGAILSLFFVENPSWRIAIIVLFTLAFATCAVFLADGKRLAVFGACAAYAAVLVVFVSGNWTPATLGPQTG